MLGAMSLCGVRRTMAVCAGVLSEKFVGITEDRKSPILLGLRCVPPYALSFNA